jgi:deazaflavin-dependent oxidoreductase (nitroreductase family)
LSEVTFTASNPWRQGLAKSPVPSHEVLHQNRMLPPHGEEATMTDTPELNWAQLDNLTTEVRGDQGPGTGNWESQGSHTQAFNRAFIDEFRRNGGKIPGELGEVDMLLITATGAKSGEPRTVPVSYHRFGDRVVVVASMGGATTNPPWFHNIKAHPEVTVEMGGETFAATAIITEGEDRDQLYAGICERMPVFAEYQERTERLIPVIELTRTG